jgi:MFS family permease
MSVCGYSFGDTAFVIQWHALGMFAPSFVTGRIIERLGVLRVTGLGLGLIAACVAINLAGVTLAHFWWALLLLGLGWNFAFVGATTLVTTTYRSEERAKVQGVNDLTIFAGVALTSFASGALQHLFGWQAVNLGVLVPVLLTAGSLVWLSRQERSRPVPATI